MLLAEAVGFEPTEGFPSTVFKTVAFIHSATPPYIAFEARFTNGHRFAQHSESPPRIPYNTGMDDEAYMRIALDEARRAAACGEVPIGAVVVYEPIDPATRRATAEPQIIAQAGNRRERTKDPAGHAEFVALEEAARALDAWRLSDCTVYVTLEPCIMCAGLMHQARVRRCVYGAFDPKAGALGTLYRINEDERLNHTFEVTSGVLADECAAELRAFFSAKRKK